MLAVRPEPGMSLLSHNFLIGPICLLWGLWYFKKDLVWDIRWELALERKVPAPEPPSCALLGPFNMGPACKDSYGYSETKNCKLMKS